MNKVKTYFPDAHFWISNDSPQYTESFRIASGHHVVVVVVDVVCDAS